jgi:hypothetical protein
VGCAVGGASFHLARAFPHVLGLDYSQHFVAAANVRPGLGGTGGVGAGGGISTCVCGVCVWLGGEPAELQLSCAVALLERHCSAGPLLPPRPLPVGPSPPLARAPVTPIPPCACTDDEGARVDAVHRRGGG